jgi:PKD repeat protein
LYSYQVSAVDNAGNQSARSSAITVTTQSCTTNQAPHANAGADQSVLTLVAVSFNGSGSTDDGTIASYAWNYGDGASATGVTASHAYSSSGVYTVTLTVTDNLGATGSDTAVVTVANRPPTANAGPDQSATTGTAVSFNGSGSSDLDGTISSYAWTFGDATIGSGVSTSHTYASAGTYTVTLTVTDNKGASSSDTATISVGSVANVPPTANAGANQSALTLVALTFNGGGSSDPDGTIASYAWNFGDGATGSGVSAAHSYASSGVYTVTLIVTDNKGATATDTATATITNRPPTANAGADKSATAGTAVSFTGSGTDPDGTIASYAWNFGDGATASGANVSHAYAAAGTFTATLTVTDNKGATASDGAVVTITVTSAPGGTYTWSRQAGGTVQADSVVPYSTATDSAGNVVVTGVMYGSVNFGTGVLTSPGRGDLFVVKYSPTGTPLWANRYGDAADQFGTGVGTDNAGNIYVTGYYFGTVDFGGGALTPTAAYDIVLAKYAPNGTHVWSKRIGGAGYDQAQALDVDGAGNVTIAGRFSGATDFGGGSLTAAGGYDGFVARYTTAGSFVWAQRFGGASLDTVTAMGIDGSGNAFAIGYFAGSGDFGSTNLTGAGGNDVFVVKVGAAGSVQWAKNFGDASDQWAYGGAVDAAGNVVVTGGFYGSLSFGGATLPDTTGGGDIFLAKLDASGAHVWSKAFGSSLSYGNIGTAVTIDGAGNVVLAGNLIRDLDFGGGPLTAPTVTYDPFVAKFGPDGSYKWAKRFAADWDDHADAVTTDSNGNVVLAGDMYQGIDFGGGVMNSPGGADLFVVKLAP